MIVTWTVLRSRRPATTVPWQPRDASWWQAGPSSDGTAGAPQQDGRWWSVLATWPGPAEAAAGPGPRDDLDAWHVVLEAVAFHGSAVVEGGARPFDGLPEAGQVEGAAAVVTFAGPSTDGGREREFFRRFLHLARGVAQAPGYVAGSVQAPQQGAVLTFSVWEDLGCALDWAYVQQQHAAAVARQAAHRLVESSGSLRGAVLSSSGTLGDQPDPLAGRRGSVVPPH